jgi:apolipoprotein N-acyltransferase
MKPRSKKDVTTARPAPRRDPNAWRLWCAAFSGTLLFIAALPLVDLQPVAWIAPLPWLWLISLEKLPGRRPYVVLWLAGFALWAVVLFGISLANPALIAGWLGLSAYVAVYTPLFVSLSRQLVHGWRVPLVIAAPLVWTGLEVIRGHFATGFAVGLLGHTQTNFPTVIQIADLGGAYAVSFVMMVAAAGALDAHYRWWQDREAGASVWRVLFAAGLVAATIIYGRAALSDDPLNYDNYDPPLRVVLIQGSLDTKFEMSAERVREVMGHYRELTERAIQQHPDFDLLVWPESSCPAYPYLLVKPDYSPPPEEKLSPEEFSERVEESNRAFATFLADVAKAANASFILSTSTLEYEGTGQPRVYNSALWTDREGKIAGVYHKMHPVMFGEYIPFFDWFPFLYRLTPMPGGLTPGKQAEVLHLSRKETTTYQIAGFEPQTRTSIGNYRLAPNICFESTVPHLVRKQVAQLRARGEEPDILVNVTNDGWFWGSGILDLHLRCSIFRAVELRKPMLIAANTGFSGQIDGNGVVQQLGPRRQPDVLYVEVRRDGRTSLYSQTGDVFGWACAAVPLAIMVMGLVNWLRQRFARRASK